MNKRMLDVVSKYAAYAYTVEHFEILKSINERIRVLQKDYPVLNLTEIPEIPWNGSTEIPDVHELIEFGRALPAEINPRPPLSACKRDAISRKGYYLSSGIIWLGEALNDPRGPVSDSINSKNKENSDDE